MIGTTLIEFNIFQFGILLLVAGLIGFSISYYYTLKVYNLIESREKKKAAEKKDKDYTLYYLILFFLILYFIFQ